MFHYIEYSRKIIGYSSSHTNSKIKVDFPLTKMLVDKKTDFTKYFIKCIPHILLSTI